MCILCEGCICNTVFIKQIVLGQKFKDMRKNSTKVSENVVFLKSDL